MLLMTGFFIEGSCDSSRLVCMKSPKIDYKSYRQPSFGKDSEIFQQLENGQIAVIVKSITDFENPHPGYESHVLYYNDQCQAQFVKDPLTFMKTIGCGRSQRNRLLQECMKHDGLQNVVEKITESRNEQ